MTDNIKESHSQQVKDNLELASLMKTQGANIENLRAGCEGLENQISAVNVGITSRDELSSRLTQKFNSALINQSNLIAKSAAESSLILQKHGDEISRHSSELDRMRKPGPGAAMQQDRAKQILSELHEASQIISCSDKKPPPALVQCNITNNVCTTNLVSNAPIQISLPTMNDSSIEVSSRSSKQSVGY